MNRCEQEAGIRFGALSWRLIAGRSNERKRKQQHYENFADLRAQRGGVKGDSRSLKILRIFIIKLTVKFSENTYVILDRTLGSNEK